MMEKEDWKIVEEKWNEPYTTITFKCDGYLVSLEAYLYKLKLVHLVYVNGVMKGSWLNTECEEGRRFYRPETKFLFSAKTRKDHLKILGKKLYSRSNYDHKITNVYPYWVSFAAFKKHLITNNKEIILIQNETIHTR